MVTMRLQKFLARSGAASRRGSEDLMTAGRVTVNGVVVTELGSKIDPDTDVVAVDGRTVEPGASPAYLVLNKPAGTLTTMQDTHGRRTVAAYMPDIPGLFPVGRLDMDTTGLLLLTTDGELSHRLTHPRYHVEKVYRAEVTQAPAPEGLERLRRGIVLDDGPTKPAGVRVVESGHHPVLEVAISEGRKHQVKRMCEAIGSPVVALHRVSFGPLSLGDLSEGQTRPLAEEEIAALRRAAGHAEKEGA